MSPPADFEAILLITLNGGLAVLVGLLGLFYSQRTQVQWMLFGSTIIFSLGAILLSSPESWGILLAPWLALLAVQMIFSSLVQSSVAWLHRRQSSIRWVVCVLVGGGLVLYSSTQADEMAPIDSTNNFMLELPSVDLQPAPTVAYTDNGRSVPLMNNDFLVGEDGQRGIEENFLATNHHHTHLIRTDGPNPAYNCHGWVFAAGKFWLRGEFVSQLLIDNGYQSVADPQVGDVVVFRRSDDGQVLHTALVRAVLPDGLVLVESKWGQLGRFLHPIDHHPYPGERTIYRSSRNGHTLRGLGLPAPQRPQRG